MTHYVGATPPQPVRALPVLHVLTDTRAGRDPLREVRAVIAATPPGLVAVQVRTKEASDRDALALTQAVIEIARPAGGLVLVDDRVDVALAAGADGVHVGATDLPVAAVRRIVPPQFVVGATVRTAEAAATAERLGATYLGAGPVAHTTTKAGLPDPLGPPGISAVTAATRLPVIAIGGVTPELVPALRAAGAHGVAVVAALSEAHDPAAVADRFLAALAPAVDEVVA